MMHITYIEVFRVFQNLDHIFVFYEGISVWNEIPIYFNTGN